MAVKPAQRAASDKWDAANMAYQTVKVRKSLLDDFRAACVARGDKVNTVLREAMEKYIRTTPTAEASRGAGGKPGQDPETRDRGE